MKGISDSRQLEQTFRSLAFSRTTFLHVYSGYLNSKKALCSLLHFCPTSFRNGQLSQRIVKLVHQQSWWFTW